jgi:hypothetical protein
MLNNLVSTLAPTFLRQNKASRDQIYAVRELDRLLGRSSVPDDGRAVVARNQSFPFAARSKIGDIVVLDGDKAKAYYELGAACDQAWRYVMHGAARAMGWNGAWDDNDMPTNIRVAKETAASIGDNGLKKVAERTERVLSALEVLRRDGYAPAIRFGDDPVDNDDWILFDGPGERSTPNRNVGGRDAK